MYNVYINIKTKKALEKLLNSGQKLKKIQDNLHSLSTEWHHKEETAHKNVLCAYKEIRLLLKSAQSFKLDFSESNQNLDSLLSSELEFYINGLHDLMISWFIYFEGVGGSGYTKSMIKTYNTLRTFLIELKEIYDENKIQLQKVV